MISIVRTSATCVIKFKNQHAAVANRIIKNIRVQFVKEGMKTWSYTSLKSGRLDFINSVNQETGYIHWALISLL